MMLNDVEIKERVLYIIYYFHRLKQYFAPGKVSQQQLSKSWFTLLGGLRGKATLPPFSFVFFYVPK